jgi:protoporphyrinogen oxidase
VEEAKVMSAAVENGKKVVIIGAGPAGLTAAYELSKLGTPAVVLEKDGTVGGLSRTVNYRGFLFDIGGHRFFTKVRVVEDLWREILGEADFLRRDRLSRIYYNRTLFYYPLRFGNALRGLGPAESMLILLSYLRAQLFPSTPEETLESWVSNRFGRRLYQIFFKTYTEKVWGMPCSQITADWAAQRIKGLSLFAAVKNALLKDNPTDGKSTVTTLIDSFHYPRRGPGMMWEAACRLVREHGNEVLLNAPVQRIHLGDHRVQAVEARIDGRIRSFEASHVISSMPVRELIARLDPGAPSDVKDAARRLNYRDFITVALIVDKEHLFPDNWIYIHEPGVKVGRIQNFKNWSPDMLPDPSKSTLGLEYFCFEGDGLWTMGDGEIIELAKRELEKLGLAQRSDIVDGMVVRVPKAYPVYDATHREALSVIRNFLKSFTNLQLVGRNGMHKYNNQDHSMLTAMLAVRNIHGANHGLWEVNVDRDYLEEVRQDGSARDDHLAILESTQPRVPPRLPSATRTPS